MKRTQYYDGITAVEIDPADERIVKVVESGHGYVKLANGVTLRHMGDGRYHEWDNELDTYAAVSTDELDGDGELVEGVGIGYVRL